jgi:hypothetical protein
MQSRWGCRHDLINAMPPGNGKAATRIGASFVASRRAFGIVRLLNSVLLMRESLPALAAGIMEKTIQRSIVPPAELKIINS